jgi:hypothetical protein
MAFSGQVLHNPVSRQPFVAGFARGDGEESE